MNILPLEDIPDQQWFRFIGIKHDDTEVPCVVYVVHGLTFIRSDDEINGSVWDALKGWRHRTEDDA